MISRAKQAAKGSRPCACQMLTHSTTSTFCMTGPAAPSRTTAHRFVGSAQRSRRAWVNLVGACFCPAPDVAAECGDGVRVTAEAGGIVRALGAVIAAGVLHAPPLLRSEDDQRTESMSRPNRSSSHARSQVITGAPRDSAKAR